ncbi:SirB2 family protein [Amphritea sp. 1_MG-2023]|uniref:SirB2 family protein n=1 Tax=Amphritea sp. 1_MG-2023 TaxID=3062670 RepID=UPI0026E3195A|nr:SirB2 family protein [Amphritea sp. 1_MG-2023]MDO6563657.1 SirB2 family protein [Amphritea sp. 1_MG-2023]
MYLALKHTHITFAVLSILLFSLRGFWMLTTPEKLQRRWVKIVPHIIDTLLLLSAIALTVSINQYPFTHDWLTAKLLGLIAYIVLGTIALKRGKTRNIRLLALLMALTCVAYIVWVAFKHSALPWL